MLHCACVCLILWLFQIISFTCIKDLTALLLSEQYKLANSYMYMYEAYMCILCVWHVVAIVTICVSPEQRRIKRFELSVFFSLTEQGRQGRLQDEMTKGAVENCEGAHVTPRPHTSHICKAYLRVPSVQNEGARQASQNKVGLWSMKLHVCFCNASS